MSPDDTVTIGDNPPVDLRCPMGWAEEWVEVRCYIPVLEGLEGDGEFEHGDQDDCFAVGKRFWANGYWGMLGPDEKEWPRGQMTFPGGVLQAEEHKAELI